MIPNGSIVEEKRCCSASGWLPDPDRMQLDELKERKRFRMADLAEGNFTICTCESKQLRLLKKAK